MTENSGNWPVTTLGEIASIQKGSTITAKAAQPGAVPVIAGGKKAAYFHNEANRAAKTITVSASGAYAGYVSFHHVPIWASDCITLVPSGNKTCLVEFLHYFMVARQDEIYSLQRGSGMPHVYGKDLAQIQMPLPPLEEQERIVVALDDHLSRLDQALSNLESSTVRSFDFRRALLENVLFGDHLLPLTTLGEHIQTRKNKGIPSDEPGAKYLGLEHVEAHGGRILGFDSAGKYRSASPIVEEGDLLYGRLRPYLNKVVVSPEKLFVSGEFIVMTPSATLDSSFLKYLLMSPSFLSFTALLDTGDRPRVSWDKIAKFEFPLPDLLGQKRIVNQIESSFAVTGSMQDSFENLNRQLRTLRHSLLKAAFSGELVNG